MKWIYFLNSKSQVFSVFKEFRARVEKESGFRLKYIIKLNILYISSTSTVKIWVSNNNSLLATLKNRMRFPRGRTKQ